MRRLSMMSAFIGSLPLGLAAGCVPTPLVRLSPRDPGVVWSAGLAVVSKEDTGVRVAIAFDHQADDVLALQVEVENDTDARFDVSPADLTYATCSSATPQSCAAPARVVDPEQVLDTLEAAHALHVTTAYQTYRRGGGDRARMIWSDAFRRTTLLPGQGYGGPVYIPVVLATKLVQLQVTAGARKFQFSFTQTEQEIPLGIPPEQRASAPNMPP